MKTRRSDSPLQSALGFLAVAGMLALVSPGIRIARADDEAATPPAAAVSVDPLLAQKNEPLVLGRKAPTCENPGEPLLDDALLEHQLHQLVRRAAAQQALAGPTSSEQGIVLNSRGYNYRPTPIRPGP